MSFKIAFVLFFLLFSVPQEIDQNKKTDFSEIIQEKNTDYFYLNDQLKKLSLEEVNTFYEACKKAKYSMGEVYALNSLGRRKRDEKKYNSALRYHEKALRISVDYNFINARIVSLNFLGIVYRRQDDIKNALIYHQSAVSLAKRDRMPDVNTKKSISIAKNSIGNIYISLNQYELAINQFNTAIEIQKSTNNLRGLAINHQNIGKAYENLSLYDKAMYNYKKSLSYNEEIDSKKGKVICNNSIACVLIKKEEYTKALKVIEDIYPIALVLNNDYYISESLSILGWAQLKLQNYKHAEKILHKSLNLAKKNNVKKHLQIQILFYLSELHEKIEDHEQAYSFYKKATDEEKKTQGLRNNMYVNNLISKQDLQSKTNEFQELENETKIKSLQLARNRNILIITLVTIALLSVVLYSVYRQHLLKNDQKILVLEQQALQTQMNPHFVFNALNSIKLYIINNEQKNAVYYLNKFSKLIRNILDVSKVKEVSLKEELSTMALYMSIENIRFDNSIDYTEKIHPDLNTDTIKLPPLVLQPFLENALWHGLSSKEGKKEIVLNAEKISENLIEINIVDNGIGREAALEIKKNKSLKRNSVGVGLTRERLTAFCNEFLNEFSLEYYDLKDLKGNPIGTKVSIQIPLS